jgi:hypothetical protein
LIRFRLRRHPSDGELLAFCDNELPAAERSFLQAHILRCQACQRQADELLEGQQRLGEILPGFPESLLEQGRNALLNSRLECGVDPDNLVSILGVNASRASCRLIEDLLGGAAVPG